MTAAAHTLTEIAEFWRVARRLHTIYAELNRTFELGMPACAELEQNVDRSETETLERIRRWFLKADGLVHVWQIRQLLQSTNLQTEENLRYLILRHLGKEPKTESDREKIDFLLVQYFAHCAPPGVIDHPITLEGVARVLEPTLGQAPARFPDWTSRLDEKLSKMNDCNSLEELQDSGALVEAREMKAAAGDRYYEPVALVAFTRFNFLARRAFFRAMHLDLHAIRADVNELEKRGFSNLDCREAGLSENESVEQLRHVVHQWKTPFRAPYSAGGESFQQLISLRQSLQRKLESAKTGVPRSASTPGPAASAKGPAPIAEPAASTVAAARATAQAPPAAQAPRPAPAPPAAPAPPILKTTPVAPQPPAEPSPSSVTAAPPTAPAPRTTQAPPAAQASAVLKAVPQTTPPPSATVTATSATSPATPPSSPSVTAEPAAGNPRSVEEEEDYLERCVADIADQLAAMPLKNSPSVSAIHLGGCKLLIATWEADAFKGSSEALRALQRAVAARTILHVCMDRYKKNEATDLDAAVEIAQRQADEMKVQVQHAKEASNIDAAVNLAATAKRLIALVEEGQKLLA